MTRVVLRPRLTRRGWSWIGAVVVVWAVVASTGSETFNPGGGTQWSRFWAAALQPRLDVEFLGLTFEAGLTTVAFAAVGSVIAVLIGLVGGVLTSATWWQRPSRTSPLWWVMRASFALPRGAHEAIWGLLFVIMLGRDPIAGVLAIAIPFGAITAKVYAEILDDAPHDAYEALLAGGSSRLVAMAYSLVPAVRGDLISYAFYRFECAIRSAVILGIIGAGGLGFELVLSFQSLNYDEMWTLIGAIMILSAAADLWSSGLRRHPSRWLYRLTGLTTAGLILFSIVHLGLGASRLFTPRTRDLAARLVADMWPPALPAGGWTELVGAGFATLQMSIIAMALASALGVVAAFLAARSGGSWHLIASATRFILLLLRSIPPPVWALVVLFVMFPGPLPGAVALGIYNLGILARLMAESIEHLDPAPRMALEAAGAPRGAGFLYSTLPQATARLTALSMYRWEVAIRETVVVGLVGAGGLGRLLAGQNAAFAYPQILATVLAYIALSFTVDLVSASVRRATR